jgi:hypothetical protein
MHGKLKTEAATQRLLAECSDGDLKWWTAALHALAEARAHDSEKERQFMETLAIVIPAARSADIVDLLRTQLSLAACRNTPLSGS